MPPFDVLAARALNAVRTVHSPTYLGLRLLLEAVDASAALPAYLADRTQARDRWRYYSLLAYKGRDADGRSDYRSLQVGSPLTTLAEAYVLALMAAEPAFRPPDCAFSHRWPAAGAGRNFEYFLDGYDRRRVRTGERLAAHPDSVVVVADIRRFYPSVQTDRVRERLAARLGRVADPAARRAIDRFMGGLLDRPTRARGPMPGIPIGPDAAHVLGHLALERVDAVMTERFGDRYLRYVDDVFVVCRREEAGEATAALRDALADDGLALNDDKQDCVPGADWHALSAPLPEAAGRDSFAALSDDVATYLLRHPDRGDALQARFRAEGFSLPVGRLASLARCSRFRRWWLGAGRLLWTGRWGWPTEDELAARGRATRDALWRASDRLRGQPPAPGPTAIGGRYSDGGTSSAGCCI